MTGLTPTQRLRHIPLAEIARFAATGGAATLVHLSVLVIAVEVAGLAAAPASGLAFCVAVTVTYLSQSYWVFRDPDHTLVRVRKFLITAVGGIVANVALMAAIVDWLGLHYGVGFVAVLIVVPTATFVVNKFWVFQRRKAP